MNNAYEMLFKSIRARCQQNHWFGPDLLSPKNYERYGLYQLPWTFEEWLWGGFMMKSF